MSIEINQIPQGITELRIEGMKSHTVIPVKMVGNLEVTVVSGPPGAGGSRYIHNQSKPATEWIVNHNLGVLPAGVTIYSIGGVVVEAEVVNVSNNQLRVLFTREYAGSVSVI